MNDDRLDRAFEALRDSTPQPTPDPRLERALLAKHPANARRRRGPRWLLPVLLVGAGTVSTAAATGWLERLWVSIRVDDSLLISEGVDGDSAQFVMDLGESDRAVVDVARDDTGFEASLERHSEGQVEVERVERRTEPETFDRHFPLEMVAGIDPVHEGTTPQGRAYSLFLVPADPDALGFETGTYLLVHERGGREELTPVGWIDPLPEGVVPTVECVPLASGGLRVRATVGREFGFEQLLWSAADADPIEELSTDDGRVRVQLDAGSDG